MASVYCQWLSSTTQAPCHNRNLKFYSQREGHVPHVLCGDVGPPRWRAVLVPEHVAVDSIWFPFRRPVGEWYAISANVRFSSYYLAAMGFMAALVQVLPVRVIVFGYNQGNRSRFLVRKPGTAGMPSRLGARELLEQTRPGGSIFGLLQETGVFRSFWLFATALLFQQRRQQT